VINLDNLTVNFIEQNYLDLEKPLFYDAFSMLDTFGVQYYEDRYLQLFAQDDQMHKEDLLSAFSGYLCEDLAKIIREHYITLNFTDTRLVEYTQLVRFLWIIQSMEDYENVSYRLYANDNPRDVLIDLICDLTPLSKPRAMELIEAVEPTIIQSIQQLVEDKIEAPVASHTLDPIVVKFAKYIGETPALGNKLINTATTNVAVEDLAIVLDLVLSSYIDQLLVKDKVKAVLDILSLLIVCTDSRSDPLGSFKRYSALFTDNRENLLVIEPLMMRMYSDFKDYATHTA